MSKGSSFRLLSLKKFNMLMNYISDFYITLAAADQASGLVVDFQVKVGENSYGRLNLTCDIARPRGTPKEPSKPVNFGPGDVSLPYWPSDFNDIKRFHVMKESELEDCDWIRLYLELALCTNDRCIPEILTVAIETTEDVEELNQMLQAPSVNFYITFKGLAIARVGELGEDVVRKVIVRRVVDEPTGNWTLQGWFGLSIGEEAEERPMTRLTYHIKLPTGDEYDDEQLPTFKADHQIPTGRPIALNLFKWKK